MITRRTFLQRLGAAVGGLTVLRHVPKALELVEAEAVPTASAAITGSQMLTASGGLCAPLSPLYEPLPLGARPIRDALPVFKATRGQIG